MSILDTLITDRTQAHVTRVKELARKISRGTNTAEELAEYLESYQRGAYNAVDLNRVGSAMLYCESALNAAGLAVTLTNVKTNWAIGDIPTEAQMQAYLDNLAALRTAINSPVYFPVTPDTMAGLTYDGANRIEMLLREIGTELDRIYAAMVRVNQFNFYCGGFTLPVGR